MISKSEIYLFIPAFNEERTIGATLEDIRRHGYSNCFVVNDGSIDKTPEIARLAKAVVISHLINRGAGAATQTAIDCARENGFPYVVLMDGDGQHLAKDIEVLAKRMEKEDCDIVIGSRFLKDISQMPRHRKGFNYIANALTNLFSKKKYTDSQSGFRMLNRQAIEKINLCVDQFGFCSEMIILAEKNKLKIAEAPITTIYTPYSLAKGQDFFTGIRTAFQFIWRVIFK